MTLMALPPRSATASPLPMVNIKPNLFIQAEQVTPNIIDNKFVNTDGTFLSSSSYYVSSKIAVVPGAGSLRVCRKQRDNNHIWCIL